MNFSRLVWHFFNFSDNTVLDIYFLVIGASGTEFSGSLVCVLLHILRYFKKKKFHKLKSDRSKVSIDIIYLSLASLEQTKTSSKPPVFFSGKNLPLSALDKRAACLEEHFSYFPPCSVSTDIRIIGFDDHVQNDTSCAHNFIALYCSKHSWRSKYRKHITCEHAAPFSDHFKGHNVGAIWTKTSNI